MDIFIGGTDTTSISVQWTLARLINNPHCFEKLRLEINTVVGSDRLVEESDVPNLPYLQAIIKESLRLHPPVPLIYRKCIKGCKINDYDITEGSRMVINVYTISRDPTYWKSPDDFVPERFLESVNKHNLSKNDMDINMQNENLNSLPFSNGRRRCPGAGLASVVLHVTLASLVQCFDWKVDGCDEKVNLEEGSGLSVGMAHPLVCFPFTVIDPLIITHND